MHVANIKPYQHVSIIKPCGVGVSGDPGTCGKQSIAMLKGIWSTNKDKILFVCQGHYHNFADNKYWKDMK